MGANDDASRPSGVPRATAARPTAGAAAGVGQSGGGRAAPTTPPAVPCRRRHHGRVRRRHHRCRTRRLRRRDPRRPVGPQRSPASRRSAALGGTCVRIGCIPSKALLESSERYLEAASTSPTHGIKVDGVELDLAAMHAPQGRGGQVEHRRRRVPVQEEQDRARPRDRRGSPAPARSSSMATTEPRTLHREARRAGDRQPRGRAARRRASTATASAPAPRRSSWDEVPEHLVVIGAGVIGLELGSVWRRLGRRGHRARVPRPHPARHGRRDRQGGAQASSGKQGMAFRTGVRGHRRDGQDGGKVTLVARATAATTSSPTACWSRPAVCRTPRGWASRRPASQVDARGRVVVDERFETNVPGRVRDRRRDPRPDARAQGRGGRRRAAPSCSPPATGTSTTALVPSVVYTDPEIASVGTHRGGAERRKASRTARGSSRSPPTAARARWGAPTGRSRCSPTTATDRILGVHAIGAHAGDLIAEAVAAMAFHASSEDLARVVHAHPTLSEVAQGGGAGGRRTGAAPLSRPGGARGARSSPPPGAPWWRRTRCLPGVLDGRSAVVRFPG